MTSEWLQIRHKTQVSDTFEVGKLYFKIDSYLPDFRDSVIFPYISLYTQAVAYTTYVESAARRALKNTSKRRLFSLGSLCSHITRQYYSAGRSLGSTLLKMVHVSCTCGKHVCSGGGLAGSSLQKKSLS